MYVLNLLLTSGRDRIIRFDLGQMWSQWDVFIVSNGLVGYSRVIVFPLFRFEVPALCWDSAPGHQTWKPAGQQ